MVELNRNATTTTQTVEYDQGLRTYMLNIYNYMTVALGITGLVAFGIGNSAASLSVLLPLNIPILLGLLAYAWIFQAKIHSMQPSTARIAFFGFALLMGISLAPIFFIYTKTSIARVFFITAATFGGMSLYGYTTKKDLTGVGNFLIMGFWGIFIAFLVNIFLHSAQVQYIASLIGVVVFTGLTAVNTQKLKEAYYYFEGNAATAARISILGAMQLYLSFINLFMMLLNILGQGQRR